MFLVWTALLVTLDQATKLWAQSRFGSTGDELPLALGFSFTYTRNTGAAFGILRDLAIPIGPVVLDGTLALGLLSAVIAAGLLVYLWRRGRHLNAWGHAALTLVLAGAVGNMIDRLRLGYVIDFIHFQVGWFDFPVFNVADSCVVIGAAVLLIASFRDGRHDISSKREEPSFRHDVEDERFGPRLDDADRP